MDRLKSNQRLMASEFAVLAQTGEKTALLCLEKHDWKLDRALENFFANPGAYYPERVTTNTTGNFLDMDEPKA